MDEITDTVNFSGFDGKDKLRPPMLDIKKQSETKDFIKYKIKTYNKNNNYRGDFMTGVDSFIYCHPDINIKLPKKNYMVNRKKKKYAYVMSIFPNPSNGEVGYLDGCLLAALGLKKQNTNADVICMITPDIKKNIIDKLEIVFDKVIKTPYIAPYDKGHNTIMMDPKLFEKCNYDVNHPFNYVFHKLHIFNPEYFPYEKVCYVDSDLVPLNYYDSLFTLDTPAGWLEYRKKAPFLESHVWDRCDFVKHGELIPKIITDIDKPVGADINAGLLVISPDKNEYEQMIDELTSPIKEWMGKGKYHTGFFDFDLSNPNQSKYIDKSYCYPEQNYLTKRYSGKWHYIEFAFASWSLDPCNSMGIHMAAFNPKPWLSQPAGLQLKISNSETPYKNNIKIPLILDQNQTNKNYENISVSYEIFNEIVLWGYINYPKLSSFLFNNTKIYGPKISFGSNIFKKLSNKKNIEYKTFKKFNVNEDLFNKLSDSQKNIVKLINNYKYYKNKIDKTPHCLTLKKIKKKKKGKITKSKIAK